MDTLPYLTRKLPPVEVISTGGLEQIEANADTLLEQVGIEIVNFPEAVEIFRGAGADVDGTRVRFPRGHVPLARPGDGAAPVHAAGPQPAPGASQIGDPYMVLVPTYGSPFIHNLDDGRRYATIEDFRNFVKLTYTSRTLHHGGGTLCEPVDLPVNKRHFEMVYSHIRYSDRAFMGSVTHPSRAQDSVDMARIVFGAETMEREHVIMGLANANSPMSWDFNMLGSAKVYAENNQIMLITPFILGGAMAPVTVAAQATQTLAEALAGMAFCQIVRPGAPVIFGSFASSMSMQSGAPTFGTPEPQLVLFVLAALARRLGVPFRSGGNFTASKLPDYQAAYESAISYMATMQAGVNFNLHTAGWLEGGLAIGYEKFILDEDQASMTEAYIRGVDQTDNGYALDAMLAGGPGQHFLGSPHTLANFENAFWRSELSNNDSFEQWEIDGGLDAAQRANVRWKRRLAEYEMPPLDEAIHEELARLDRAAPGELPRLGRLSARPAVTSGDPLLQPFQLRHLTLRNRIMSPSPRAGLRGGRQAQAALPALPRGEGEGRHRPDDVRRVDQRRAGLAAGLRPAVRRRRRHHPVVPADGRPDARPRHGDHGPAHPPRPADGLATTATGCRRSRRHRSASRPIGASPRRWRRRTSGGSCRAFGDGGAALQGRRPRRPRARGLRPPDRPVLVAARQPARRDRYGGSLENRMRFSIEVLEAIRAAVGDDFIVGIRMTGARGRAGRPDRGGRRRDRDGPGADRDDRLRQRRQGLDRDRRGAVARHPGPGHAARAGARARRPVPRAAARCRSSTPPGSPTSRPPATRSAEGLVDMVGMMRAHMADPAHRAQARGGRGGPDPAVRRGVVLHQPALPRPRRRCASTTWRPAARRRSRS